MSNTSLTISWDHLNQTWIAFSIESRMRVWLGLAWVLLARLLEKKLLDPWVWTVDLNVITSVLVMRLSLHVIGWRNLFWFKSGIHVENLYLTTLFWT